MIVLPILTVFFIVFLIVHVIQILRDRPTNFPPGPPRLPLWGSYWFVLKENYYHPHLAFEKLSKKYKTDILGLYLGDAPCIVPMSHKLAKESLLKDEFNGRNDTIITRMRGLGEMRGIFFIDGPYWKEQRRFSLRNLRDFGFGRRSDKIENMFVREVKDIIDIICDNSCKRDISNNIVPEKNVALFPDIIYSANLNTVLHMLTSTKFDDKKLINIALNGLKFQRSGDATGCAISMTPWLKNIDPNFFGFTDAFEGNQVLFDFIKNIVEEHKQSFSKDHFRDFIDVFINEQQKCENVDEFTDRQLIMTVVDYMFPSAIAIGHTMSFYFAWIANNKEIQEKIRNEIDKVVGNSRIPNLDDRKFMPYTEATIRESIRIIPLNPLGIPRRCTEDTTFAGYFIPKNTIVLPSVWTAHRDPTVWDEPEKFKPERFLDKKGELLKQDLTIGFGAGKRLCAGETFARQNMFLLVAILLQSFEISPAYVEEIDMYKIVPGVNLSLENNYLRFKSR